MRPQAAGCFASSVRCRIAGAPALWLARRVVDLKRDADEQTAFPCLGAGPDRPDFLFDSARLPHISSRQAMGEAPPCRQADHGAEVRQGVLPAPPRLSASQPRQAPLSSSWWHHPAGRAVSRRGGGPLAAGGDLGRVRPGVVGAMEASKTESFSLQRRSESLPA